MPVECWKLSRIDEELCSLPLVPRTSLGRSTFLASGGSRSRAPLFGLNCALSSVATVPFFDQPFFFQRAFDRAFLWGRIRTLSGWLRRQCVRHIRQCPRGVPQFASHRAQQRFLSIIDFFARHRNLPASHFERAFCAANKIPALGPGLTEVARRTSARSRKVSHGICYRRDLVAMFAVKVGGKDGWIQPRTADRRANREKKPLSLGLSGESEMLSEGAAAQKPKTRWGVTGAANGASCR